MTVDPVGAPRAVARGGPWDGTVLGVAGPAEFETYAWRGRRRPEAGGDQPELP
ncbi:hypothetical protein [Modestobacter sp. SYSU DS0511]